MDLDTDEGHFGDDDPPTPASPASTFLERSEEALHNAQLEIAKLRSVDGAFATSKRELGGCAAKRIGHELGESCVTHMGGNEYAVGCDQWTFRFAVSEEYPFKAPDACVRHNAAAPDDPWIPFNDMSTGWVAGLTLEAYAYALMVNISDRAREYYRQSNALFDQAIDIADPCTSTKLFDMSRALEERVRLLMPSVLTEDVRELQIKGQRAGEMELDASAACH